MSISSELPSVMSYLLNFNKGGFVEKTLQSILEMDYLNLNLIFSDDSSTDGSFEASKSVAEKFSREDSHTIGLEWQRRSAPSGSVFAHTNFCLKKALEDPRASYLSFLHADDLYSPQLVKKQVEFLEAHPDVGAVVTAGEAIDEKGKVLWPIQLPAHLKSPILDPVDTFKSILSHGNSFLICPSALYRKSVFEQLGPFEEKYRLSGDLEYFLRILFSNFKLGYLNEPLVQFRLSEGQASQVLDSDPHQESDFFSVMDQYLLQVELEEKEQVQYESLRRLDQLKRSLILIAREDFSGSQGSEKNREFKENLKWFQRSKNRLSGLGGVDRFLVRSAVLSGQLLQSRFGSSIAKSILNQTDYRSPSLLRFALWMKRKVRG